VRRPAFFGETSHCISTWLGNDLPVSGLASCTQIAIMGEALEAGMGTECKLADRMKRHAAKRRE
jgi:hypothetical protein